jgi:hypothetical protein
MGQGGVSVRRPPRRGAPVVEAAAPQARAVLRQRRGVAVHVAFERHVLKPGYHLIGNHLKPGAFKLWVNCIQRAEPCRGRQRGARGLDVAARVAFER